MTHNERYKNNVLLLKSFDFSLKIIDYTEVLQDKRKYVIANQLLKSGTSIGANSKEAQNADPRIKSERSEAKIKQTLYIN